MSSSTPFETQNSGSVADMTLALGDMTVGGESPHRIITDYAALEAILARSGDNGNIGSFPQPPAINSGATRSGRLPNPAIVPCWHLSAPFRDIACLWDDYAPALELYEPSLSPLSPAPRHSKKDDRRTKH
ncbi:hypothetical protein AX17_006767 [Amanita inopinata Kibby_2008]|nr:hypothetical protein AX17_006767 [Amanita inopinata Kibby_2008]